MAVGIVVFQIFPSQLFMMFDASETMLAIGVPALRTISLSFAFAGFCIVTGSVFQALGNGVYSMIVSIARQLIVLLPVAYLLLVTIFFLIRINRNIICHIGDEHITKEGKEDD